MANITCQAEGVSNLDVLISPSEHGRSLEVLEQFIGPCKTQFGLSLKAATQDELPPGNRNRQNNCMLYKINKNHVY